MSLLLEALRRAEEDSRKRKMAAALASSPAQAPVAAPARPTPAAMEFPDLALTADEPPAAPSSPETTRQTGPVALDPGADPHALDRSAKPADRPGDGLAAAPVQREAVTPAADSAPAHAAQSQPPQVPIAKAAAEPLELAGRVAAPVSMPATTPRQALAAAGALAGGLHPPKAAARPRRRQWVLAAVALLLALPLALLLLFGDAFFGGSGPQLVVNSPRTAAPLPGSAPAAAPLAGVDAAPVVPAGAAASGGITAAVPVPAEALAAPAAGALVAMAGQATPAPLQARPAPRAAPRPREPAAAPSAGVARNPPSAAATPSSPASGPSLIAGAAKPPSPMQQAYAAYQAGKLDEANRLYREVLRADPTQRDAWLGLAVMAHADNRREPALDAYKRVLRLEPQNATALAGIIALNQDADEPRQESRLRELLARSPQEADLNHALGLVLSGEQRWPEAQPLFFKAHALAPQEPRFAYNLAVTLDHLRKPGLALQYYETALQLAQGKAAGFDEAGARNRLAQLRAVPAQGSAQ